MLNPSEKIHRWLCGPSSTPPAYVAAAMRQVDRYDGARAQHWIDWSDEELQRFLSIVDQQRLEFDEEDSHANVRSAIARYLEQHVAPTVADPTVRKLAGRLRDARQSGTIMYRKQDQKFVTMWDSKAGLPLLCPDDAREEAMRVQRRVVPAIVEALKQQGARVYYAVFTMPNAAPGKLAPSMRSLYKRFNSLMRKCKRDGSLPFLGAYAVMESPLAAGRDWHPHLNVILVTSGWFDYADLRKLWHWNVHVERLHGSQAALEAALRELIKYSCRAVPEKSNAKANFRSAAAAGGGACGPDGVRRARPDDASSGSTGCAPGGFRENAEGLADAAATDERAAPPALIEWTSAEFLEWWYAHKGFRRSRGYGCLFRLENPEAESLEGFQAIGTVHMEGGRLRRTFALLESIPGDKSSGESWVDRYRRAVQRLAGDPSAAREAISITERAMQAWQTIENPTH